MKFPALFYHDYVTTRAVTPQYLSHTQRSQVVKATPSFVKNKFLLVDRRKKMAENQESKMEPQTEETKDEEYKETSKASMVI